MFYLSSSILIKSQRDKFTLILRSYPFSGREKARGGLKFNSVARERSTLNQYAVVMNNNFHKMRLAHHYLCSP
jgi:hypothetical protein